jgi:hypothetical protein
MPSRTGQRDSARDRVSDVIERPPSPRISRRVAASAGECCAVLLRHGKHAQGRRGEGVSIVETGTQGESGKPFESHTAAENGTHGKSRTPAQNSTALAESGTLTEGDIRAESGTQGKSRTPSESGGEAKGSSRRRCCTTSVQTALPEPPRLDQYPIAPRDHYLVTVRRLSHSFFAVEHDRRSAPHPHRFALREPAAQTLSG